MKDLKILLVEDAPDVQLLVSAALNKKFQLNCVGSAEEARVELTRNKYSLIILDVGLPGEDGFKFCANIRADERYREVPIVFLTSKHQTRDKVLAFSIGADDYIVKPLEMAEFQARIEAKMRRVQDSAEDRNHFTKGPFRVVLTEQKVYLTSSAGAHRDLGLTTIEFKLFYYFLRHENHVLTRAQILDAVWIETHVTDRVVDTYVYSLRKKLGAFGSSIRSVPRVGYKLSLSDTAKVA